MSNKQNRIRILKITLYSFGEIFILSFKIGKKGNTASIFFSGFVRKKMLELVIKFRQYKFKKLKSDFNAYLVVRVAQNWGPDKWISVSDYR